MLSLFVAQYGNDVRSIKIMNAPRVDLNLEVFGGLERVIFEEEVSTAFEIVTKVPPNGSQPGAEFRVSFPEFEPGATDNKVEDAIFPRRAQLREDASTMRRGPSFTSRYITIWAFHELVKEREGRKRFEVLMILRWSAASSLRFDYARGGRTKLVIDGNTDEVLAFKRP